MSRIDELIQQLCPDGVEYKPLGDIVNILDSQRKPISKGKRIPGKIPSMLGFVKLLLQLFPIFLIFEA